MNPDPGLTRTLEELSLRAWPCLEEKPWDGWLLRFAEGYTRRANSIQVLEAGCLPLAEKVAACEVEYAKRNLPTIFKVTPLADPFGLDRHLEERGYERQSPTRVQVMDLTPGAMLPGLSMVEGETREWQQRFGAWSGLPQERHPLLARILGKISGRAFFGTYSPEGKPVACASGVLEGDWVGIYEVVTDPAERGRGHGKKLVGGLQAWAFTQGAKRAYLQVMEANHPALALYGSAGFREAYGYHYRVRPVPGNPQPR